MNLNDEYKNIVTETYSSMTRSRSESTESLTESVNSNLNETKQSVFIDEIIQDDIKQNFFCLSCCYKFENNLNFLKHLNHHHLNHIDLSNSQEKFLRDHEINSEQRFLILLIDFKIKVKFLQKYSHDLLVLNEETALYLEELNKEENEENEFSDSSLDKDTSFNDENSLYETTKTKLSLLFVDYSIIKLSRIFSILKDLYISSYPVLRNSSESKKELSNLIENDKNIQMNENKSLKKTSNQVIHSRNACKKLKCPKCNWHYKYRETLDIHMREKHSTDLSQTMSQQCIYCIENIQHPRLGRGEQYKCGYKPYRCDICDYSTTTKGNLSIHMQSDKHMNNLKDININKRDETDKLDKSSDLNETQIETTKKQPNKKYLNSNSKNFSTNTLQDHGNYSSTSTTKSVLKSNQQSIDFLCPLCQTEFFEQSSLENHLKESHCVINEEAIKTLIDQSNKTMISTNEDERMNKYQQDETRMNQDETKLELVLNNSEFDLYIDNFLSKHNDILDTLINSYLLKNKLVYKQFLNNLLNDSIINLTAPNEDTDIFNVICSNCSCLKFTNLVDFKKHQIDKHLTDRAQLNLLILKNCLKHFCPTSKQDELKIFIKSKTNNLNDTTVDLIACNLLINRMNKTFSLNTSTSKPAANKLPFSAESLLSQPKPVAQPTEQYSNLMNYFKTSQMANSQQNSLLNQLFLPLMLSSSPSIAAAAVAAAAVAANPNPTPASPVHLSEDSVKSDNLDESLDMNQNNSGNRRRRTRITEDQLKVLRQYFDINKSPTDEQIIDIARRTHLQAKVIKHWFRNTLFKERQKDKDSPYNFNNPPLTQLNLEEYEKTGKIVSEPAPSVSLNTSIYQEHKHEENLKQENLNETTSSSDENQNMNEHLNVEDDDNEEQNLDLNSNSRCSSVGLKNRPNRTKFNESQIKALNVAFRQQKYPKDEQISQLAKQLSLKPRVITVWFQNARQKARKSSMSNKDQNDDINNSNAEELDEYYDMNDDCDDTQSQVSSSTDKSSKSQSNGDNLLAMAAAQAAQAAANAKALQLQLAMSLLAAHQQQQIQQNEKSSSSSSASSTDSKKNDDEEDEIDDDDDDMDDYNEDDETDSSKNNPKLDSIQKNMPSTKRLRTTILPEQQEFLMQKYQVDQNPSRKMLDEIAKQVRLKKRVVQVWFQNTRARERKGIIKINPTVNTTSTPALSFTPNSKTLKKCSLCSQNFRSKSELESHLILKHNYSYEQASSFDCEDEIKVEPKIEPKSAPSRPKSPVQYPQNGLNTMLMSTLFAHLQQQQQQPFDLSFKPKTEPSVQSPIIKPISQNVENRSRSSSSSGTATISKIKPVNTNVVKKEMTNNSQMSQSVAQNQRRVRTQMTQYQVNVMRLIFAEYKTPTMNECETMGREINLKKRVVQVWFQNARAKEKKNNSNGNRSILFSNTANNDLSNFEFSPDECLLCNLKYNHTGMNNGGVSQQQREHLFSKQHLGKLIQFVTKIAVENGANPVEFTSKNGQKNDDEDESELDDDVNSDDEDEQSVSQENESQEIENKQEETKQNTSFDMNRLLQLPQQTPQNSQQLYNYFLYSNLMNQPKIMPNINSSSASSTSSTCSSTSTPSSTNTSPFYNQFPNPVLAQIYAALAAQQQTQLFTLDSLNLPKTVQFDIEKKLASSFTPTGLTTTSIQYTLDGSTKSEICEKYNLNSDEIDEQVQQTYHICRTCRCVSLNRESLLTHQCLNQIVNMNLNQTNLFKMEQIGYKCLICANQSQTPTDYIFSNSNDFVEHATKLGHFMLKKSPLTTSNGVLLKRKSDETNIDSNNNKKIKY